MWSNLGSGRVPLRIAPNSLHQRSPVATAAVPASRTRPIGLRIAVTLPPRPRRRRISRNAVSRSSRLGLVWGDDAGHMRGHAKLVGMGGVGALFLADLPSGAGADP